jgi:hypothetical protein
MSDEEKVVPIDGQCGTCNFASCFDYATSPSGPEDGVHCVSEKQAKLMDEQTGSTQNVAELKEFGFMDLWRLEAMAEPTFRCENWEPKKEGSDAKPG